MTKDSKLDDNKKNLLLKNDDVKKYFLIIFFKQVYEKEEKDTFFYNEYESYNYILFSKSDKKPFNKDGKLTKRLKEFFLPSTNKTTIDNVYLEYLRMANSEGKRVLYSLSRLLYIQDKYKDEEIGKKIDSKIKEWQEYIKQNYKKNAKTIKEEQKDLHIADIILNSLMLYQIIPSLNYDIHRYKDRRPFTKLWNYDVITDEEFINFLDNEISRQLSDSETYTRYIELIDQFLNDIENDINTANFNSDKEGNRFKLDDAIDKEKWQSRTDNFIEHLETYDGVTSYENFTMDYTLNHLAYNDYQKEEYKLNLEDDIKIIKKDTQEQPKKKNKRKPKPKLATQEEIQAYCNKVKEYYNTSTLPTNKAILDTYGAYASIETNALDKINLKIKELEREQANTNDKEQRENIKYELDDLLRKKKEQEDIFNNLNDTIEEKQNNLDRITQEYTEKEQHLSNADKQQYKNLIQTLQVDLIDAKDDLNAFNNRGIAFRGNIFNELEYTDDKGKTIATIRNKNGNVLEPKDIPPLGDLFLTLINDNYYTRLDNYNEFIDKVDILYPKSKGASYKIANETIKRNLGKNGYIISVKSLLKNVLHVSEDSFKYYSSNLEDAIKFFNDTQINVQQQDKYTKNDDVLNMFFGLTTNVYMSRQVNNDIYLYYEISSVYETILNNGDRPVISQNPKALLKYSTGQKGNRRVFKLGNYIYNNLRESLNNGKGGIKIDDNGHFYKKFKVKSLLKVLKESNLINKEARPRKYREDIFNPLINTLNTLSVDDEGNGERLIEYTILYDDSLNMSNDTFKATFEEAIVIIIYLKYSEDYEDILAKNIRNKKKACVTNANKFILTFGKYEGKTLKEVLDIDKHYLETILSDTSIKIPKPKITRQHIKNLLDYDKDKEQLKNK